MKVSLLNYLSSVICKQGYVSPFLLHPLHFCTFYCTHSLSLSFFIVIDMTACRLRNSLHQVDWEALLIAWSVIKLFYNIEFCNLKGNESALFWRLLIGFIIYTHYFFGFKLVQCSHWIWQESVFISRYN